MKKTAILMTSTLLISGLVQAEIGYSTKIDKEKIDVMKSDIKVLKSLTSDEEVTNAYKNFFGSERFAGEVLDKYLNDRVQFVVEDGYLQNVLQNQLYEVIGELPTASKVKIVDTSRAAENFKRNMTRILGKDLSSEGTYKGLNVNSDNNSGTVMSNTGAAIYTIAKQSGNLLVTVPVETEAGVLKAPVSSPRVGIIEVGPVLFNPRYVVNQVNPAAPVNSMNRMATFIHEGRHSDGNEASNSLAFFHLDCPKGHDLEGAPACDDNINGPYAHGGVFMYEAAKKCGDDCSEEEKAGLLARAMDSFSRILQVNGTHLIKDSTPEGQRSENQ